MALAIVIASCAWLMPYREAVLVVRCAKSTTPDGSNAQLTVVIMREKIGETPETITAMKVDGDCEWSVDAVKEEP